MKKQQGPLQEALRQYTAAGRARFHMPGHKGRRFAGLEAAPCDITEIPGADSLYDASDVIAASERRMAQAYRVPDTLYSAGGATLAIQAMLFLAQLHGRKILCARNLHVSAVSAMALLDIEPVWVTPVPDAENPGLPGRISPAAVDALFARHPDASALYVTSPNYFGQTSNIVALAGICRNHGALLLVDNAHGAHLPWSGGVHPMAAGADLCVDSAHKTLPVRTGGAYLHLSAGFDRFSAKRAMALFGSTSPSYEILRSLDATAAYLSGGQVQRDFNLLLQRIARIEAIAVQKGLRMPSGERDRLHISLCGLPVGWSGEALGGFLREHGVEPEYVSPVYVVLLASVCNTGRDFTRLARALQSLPAAAPLPFPTVEIPPAQRVLSLREAVLSATETLAVPAAQGRVAASLCSICPPGVPVVMPGERISAEMAKLLFSTGISSVKVVK